MEEAGPSRAADAAVVDADAADDVDRSDRVTGGPGFPAGTQPVPKTAPQAERTVAAIVVITEPSPELASTLRALTRQDVPVAILVVDDASAIDPTPVVAETAPGVFVTRLDAMSGWCAAANSGAELVSGAHWLLICHDDVAPAPDAVRSMLDAAAAAGADIVVPKLVSWADHERLRSVGFAADRSATAIDRVDANELDQGQHDFVSPTVAAHSACILVKAETFARVGGFDPAMSAPMARPSRRRGTSSAEQGRLGASVTAPERGEDLDLCWRIIAAGGIAVVDPGARVAHAERCHRCAEAPDGVDPDVKQRDPAAEALRTLIGRRNRLRTVASVLRGPAMVRGLAALLFQRLVLIGTDLPFPAVRHLVPRLGVRSLLQRRRAVSVLRSRPVQRDATRVKLRDEGKRLESQLSAGAVTLRKVLRTEVAKDSSQALILAGDAVAVGWKRGPIRLISGLLLVTMAALLLGSRKLLGGIHPHGQFVPVPGFGDILRAYGSSWRDIGTGGVAPSPPGLLVAMLSRLAGLGTDRLTGLLTTTFLLPVGVIGAGRLGAAVARSCRERAVGDKPDADLLSMEHSTGVLSTALCAALYGATPVATNAIRNGSWEGLLLFAALPWLLHTILASTGQLVGRRGSDSALSVSFASLVRVGFSLGVLASVAPPVAIVAVVVTLLLWLASLLADGSPMSDDERRGPPRSVLLVGGGALVAIALLGVWVLELVRTPTVLRGAGPTSPPADVSQVLRLTAGPAPDGLLGIGGWLGVGLLVAAVLTLLLVNGRRLWWAVRWWTVSLGFGAAMWSVDRGPLVGLLPSHEVLSVPLALGLVVVITVGLSGVAQDIRRAQFGWRQAALITAVAAAVVTVIPLGWSSRRGDWFGGLSDARRSTEWIADSADSGLFRTVWIGTAPSIDGDANPLPGETARPQSSRVVWVMSGVAPPTVSASWGGSPRRGTVEIANALAAASQRSTFRLGSRIAPAAIRYIVVTGNVGRASERAIVVGGDAGPLRTMLVGLEQQLDLREVQRDDSTIVYENTGWVPRRAVNGQPAFVGAGSRTAVAAVLPAGTLRVADTADPGWRLSVAGAEIPSSPSSPSTPSTASPASDRPTGSAGSAGVAGRPTDIGVSFEQPGGSATLRHRASFGWTLARWLQILLWSGAIVGFLLDWSARRRHLEDLVAEIHSTGGSTDDHLDSDAWDSSLTVEGAFRSDDEVYAEVFADPFGDPSGAPRRRLGRGHDLNVLPDLTDPSGSTIGAEAHATPARGIATADPGDTGGGESLADQLWSEWSARHGRTTPDADEHEQGTDERSTDERSTGEQGTDDAGVTRTGQTKQAPGASGAARRNSPRKDRS